MKSGPKEVFPFFRFSTFSFPTNGSRLSDQNRKGKSARDVIIIAMSGQYFKIRFVANLVIAYNNYYVLSICISNFRSALNYIIYCWEFVKKWHPAHLNQNWMLHYFEYPNAISHKFYCWWKFNYTNFPLL